MYCRRPGPLNFPAWARQHLTENKIQTALEAEFSPETVREAWAVSKPKVDKRKLADWLGLESTQPLALYFGSDYLTPAGRLSDNTPKSQSFEYEGMRLHGGSIRPDNRGLRHPL